MSKIDLEDFLKNKKNMSPEEFTEFLEMAKASGKTAMMTVVDDPKSPETKAAREYIKSHRLLPKNYENTTVEEIEECGKRLLDPTTKIKEKKKSLMLLAHQGVYESYRILKKYRENPDPELHFWAEMAFEECQTFVSQMLSPETLVAFTKLRKTGRNEPCPCGSGKKFKTCCGKRL